MHLLLKYKRCAPFGIIYRHFRSNSVNLMPRGGAISERRREKSLGTAQHVEIQPIDGVHHTQPQEPKSFVASEPSHEHKNTKPIDSMDPVILKYVNLLNKGSVAQEKVHATNFGSIRFDNDNVPEVHGQFDIVEGPDEAAWATEILTNARVHPQNEKRLINDEDHVPELTKSLDHMPSADHYIELEKQMPKSSIGLDKPKSSHQQSVMSESEKAFEELFGKDTFDSDAYSVHESSETVHSTVNSSTNKSFPNTHNEGFIDEQFFNEAIVKSNMDISNSPAQHYDVSHSIKPDFTKSFHTQDVGSTNDLNFIDQTFFKSSLDTLEENRRPAVEFSEIKKDLEKAVDNMSSMKSKRPISKAETENLRQEDDLKMQSQQVSNIALEYLGIDPSTESPSLAKSAGQQTKEKKETPDISESTPKSAYDYVLKKRKESHDSKFGFGVEGENPTGKSYHKVLSLVKEKTSDNYTKHEVLALLKKSIIFDKYDIVGLYKPYGVAMHGGTQKSHHILTECLPEIAKHLQTEELHPVHRLDATTTGVLLLARTPAMAATLKDMLKKQEIKKTYWAITKGIPRPFQGLIDIPIAEGSVDGKHRMVLRPDVDGFRGASNKCHRAITGYKVLGRNVNSAFVEISPQTGVKHQVRVHLGFGLSCPILGDHKYSHLKKMAPQRLPGDLLERLKLQQSKVRNLPIYLHSRSVLIPEIADGRNVFIRANLPAFFNKTLSILKLNTKMNGVRYIDSKCIDE